MEEPETYLFSPTPYVPNSPLPVLIYRAVLEPASASQDGDAQALSADSLRNQIEQNKWRYGGVFKHYPTHHFHSVTHECYAVFKGRSRLLLGRGPLDEANDGHGKEVELRAGDIIVLPGSPHWDNNWCKASPEETMERTATAWSVPIPSYDPIYGKDGPLCTIWRQAQASAALMPAKGM
ncbi:hypothetical protein HRR78_004636 [Exophiala dermatitidis]|nr:hypothetical protein HRR75_000105 [Exophiala dermatitidis]KAJ4549826.1 hypothetical protein HRR78_004636 [Exophiala dermatitidis]